MFVSGQCLCGEIAFRATVDPEEARICHCTDCQRLSGAPFRVVISCPEPAFVLLKGTPRIYVKTAESGQKREQAFCGTCGSALFATSATPPGDRMIRIRAGILDQANDIVPRKQLWTQSALDWLPELPGTPYKRGL